MAQQPKIDDKYRSGIWYDGSSGNFVKIREVNGTIGLYEPEHDPDNNDPYYTFDEDYDHPEDIVAEINADMMGPVSTSAVENPAETVRRAVRLIACNDPNELMTIPYQENIDLRYARTQTQIIE